MPAALLPMNSPIVRSMRFLATRARLQVGAIVAPERAVAEAVRMAVDSGELRADTDPRQFVFEMFGLVLAFYHTQRLLGDAGASARALAGFERLVDAHRPPARKTASRPAAPRR